VATGIASELRNILVFLNKNPRVRTNLAAPRDKTIVYSGDVNSVQGVFAAWKLLAQAKRQDPRKFDYVTLEERLRAFHIIEFGESLFDHASRVSNDLKQMGLERQAMILWRALSGIYVRGATGRVRALILPGNRIGQSVFSLTEVHVLLKPDVLANIDINPRLLQEFRTVVRSGLTPSPLVVF
jgi:hypothetical protein